MWVTALRMYCFSFLFLGLVCCSYWPVPVTLLYMYMISSPFFIYVREISYLDSWTVKLTAWLFPTTPLPGGFFLLFSYLFLSLSFFGKSRPLFNALHMACNRIVLEHQPNHHVQIFGPIFLNHRLWYIIYIIC